MSKKFYITTPIYYPSGNWHIGHCYTTVICDAIARFKRMDGFDVFYLTGTDEHGQKIEQRAKEAGVTPKVFVDNLVGELKELWKVLDISYNKYIRTTDESHKAGVQKIFQKLYDKGDIYKGEYKGWYCTPCESFWTDSQLKDGNCPDCGRKVSEGKEEAYFFRLSKYQKQLEEFYKKNPTFISPKSRMNEMLNNFIKPGLDDLCVSRSTFKWGVPVPFDKNHVVYVWIDALSNYITALGYLSDDDTLMKKYWPAQIHMVGKEIVRFHTIIWPILLMALELPLPDMVYGHGWLLLGGDKMSKSKGNVVDPFVLAKRYGADALRYFLLREVPFGSDGNYSNELLLARTNADLANDLGNLVSRTLAMVSQSFNCKIPEFKNPQALDHALIDLCESLIGKVRDSIEKLLIPESLTEIFKVIQRANKYIDETMPWALAKQANQKERLGTVLYTLAETMRFVAVTLAPFIPETSQKIFTRLNLGVVPKDFNSLKKFGLIKPGTEISKGDSLFPRIDVVKELKELDEIFEQSQSSHKEKIQISIEDFSKVELATAKVLDCEKIEKSDKLLKLTLDVAGKTRTVVSGIALNYTPEYMIGKTVVIVKNLKPAKLRGIESCGMILCASKDGQVIFVTPEKDIASGSEVC